MAWGIAALRRLVSLTVLVLLAYAAPASAEAPPYRSLTRAFADFATETANLPMYDRVARFRTQFDRLLPGFYRPRDGRTNAEFDRIVANALLKFPADRAGYEAVERGFAVAFEAGLAHFRQAFPGFRPTLPVYFVHSLGELDGGTRFLGRKQVLIFGADGIARYDTPDSVPMLLDHEFFHVVHHRYFPGCFAVWCRLWREGLAVHAAATLNPGATDQQLGLAQPAPLRPAVDAHWRRALCLLESRLSATDRATNRMLFLGNGGNGPLPPRFAYYLGYRIAQRAGQTHALQTLMMLPPAQARLLLTTELASMTQNAGGCTTVAQTGPARPVAYDKGEPGTGPGSSVQ